jgi:predicted methyltransferase
VTPFGRLKVGFKRLMYSPAGRDRRQRPDEMMAALALRPGQTVVDLGSGTGYYTFRMARAVEPDGRVYAVDTDADLLDDLAHRAAQEGIGNLRTTHPGPTDAGLPESVDLVFLSHVYHHLPDQVGYFARLTRNLKAGGRVAIVEGRRQGWARIFGHATEPEIVRREMEAAGYRLVSSHDIVPRESFQIFEPARSAESRPTTTPGT